MQKKITLLEEGLMKTFPYPSFDKRWIDCRRGMRVDYKKHGETGSSSARILCFNADNEDKVKIELLRPGHFPSGKKIWVRKDRIITVYPSCLITD